MIKTMKDTYTQVQEVIDQMKAFGEDALKEELIGEEAKLRTTKNLYARMGIVGRMNLIERALKELEVEFQQNLVGLSV
jgi:hypothetical protein